ncbi:MAG: hypothetical protein R3F59_16565 [Myxococcota bacterium]
MDRLTMALTFPLAAGLLSACAVSYPCANLKSTAGELGADTFYLRGSRCEDGVVREVQCVAQDGDWWQCTCYADGVAGNEITDSDALYDELTNDAQHRETLDRAMYIAEEDCGW